MKYNLHKDSNCCNGGYWRDNHTKFIKTNKVKQYIFKYKYEVD